MDDFTSHTPGEWEYEREFDLFGSRVRLLIGQPTRESLPSPEAMGLQIEGFLRVLHRRLTRFNPDSELSRLNGDAAATHQASSVLAAAVMASIWAADRSHGLIDPTLLRDLQRAGYVSSLADAEPEPLAEALAAAPERMPARPDPRQRWRQLSVDTASGVVRRPPGLRIDSGGCGKGLAADLASDRLSGYAMHVVDAGGDLRIGGERPLPRLVQIDHPLRYEPAGELSMTTGAVATSGIDRRIWRTPSGYAHHLLDPSTGQPAWTGVIQATAIAPTALEAETLAKMALLSGPERGLETLGEHGGLLVLDDGFVINAGPLARETPLRQETA